MSTLLDPSELVKNTRVRDLLDWRFDLQVLSPRRGINGYQIIGAAHCEVFAQDKAGGDFVLCWDTDLASAMVVRVTSEGAAGVIGADLRAFLGMLVALPCWEDVLKFSGRGTLEIMRRSQKKLDKEYRASQPRIESACAEVAGHLQLTLPADPVYVLHSTVSQLSPRLTISSPDGEYESLFDGGHGEYKPHIK